MATKLFYLLVYEGVMMGLLVTGRQDRAWNEHEKSDSTDSPNISDRLFQINAWHGLRAVA